MKARWFLATVVAVLISAGVVAQSCSPWALYHFTGDATDASGNGHHGTAIGPTLTTDMNSMPNEAYDFDGVDDLIDCGDIIDMSAQNAISISAWFYVDALGSGNDYSGIAFGKTDSSSVVLRCRDSTDMRFEAIMGNPGEVNFNSMQGDNNHQLSVWYHLVGVYKNFDVQLYINGSAQTTASSAGGGVPFALLTDNADHLRMGSTFIDFDDQKFFDGRIDEVGIYDCALTPQDVMGLYLSSEEEYVGTVPVLAYPNPATTEVNLQAEKPKRIRLTTVDGQTLLTTKYTNKVDVSKLPAGVYILQVLDRSGTVAHTQRVVVQ